VRKNYTIAQRIKSLKGEHISWNTEDNDKTIRLNSRNYDGTSGDIIGFQSKPRANASGTQTVYGAQLSPGANDGIGLATIVGLQTDVYLKGSSGNLSGDVRAFQGQVTDQNLGGRTVSGVVSILDAWHQLHSGHTLSGGVFVINARAAGGGAGWTGFLRAAASGAGGLVVSADGMTANPEGDTEAGYLQVRVGSTDYQIPIYAA